MKPIILSLFFLLGFAATAQKMTTLKSEFTARETQARLEKIIKEKGLYLFETIDHQRAASKAELSLSPTTVVMFGNPKMGTPLMQSDPRVGLELPMKMLIFETAEGVFIGYHDPLLLSESYQLSEQEEQLKKMSKAVADLAHTATSE